MVVDILVKVDEEEGVVGIVKGFSGVLGKMVEWVPAMMNNLLNLNSLMYVPVVNNVGYDEEENELIIGDDVTMVVVEPKQDI